MTHINLCAGRKIVMAIYNYRASPDNSDIDLATNDILEVLHEYVIQIIILRINILIHLSQMSEIYIKNSSGILYDTKVFHPSKQCIQTYIELTF